MNFFFHKNYYLTRFLKFTFSIIFTFALIGIFPLPSFAQFSDDKQDTKLSSGSITPAGQSSGDTTVKLYDTGIHLAETKTVIRVENDTISLNKFNQMYTEKLDKLKRRKRVKSETYSSKKLRKKVKNQIKNKLLRRLILEFHASKSNVDASRAVKDNWAKMRRKLGGGSEERLRERLKKRGKNPEKLKENMRTRYQVKFFIQDRVTKATVSDTKIDKIYKKRKDSLSALSERRAKYLIHKNIITKKKKIRTRKLLRELKNKTDLKVNI